MSAATPLTGVYENCDAGLFHSEEPLHSHRHCKSCFRMGRCEGKELKLLRCMGCCLETYCSKECQKAHWKAGHKHACAFYSVLRTSATIHSGNPDAWSQLMTWKAFHDTTLINATLACFLLKKGVLGHNIAADYFLQISLLYHDDPSLPVERRFEVRGKHFTHRDEFGLGMVIFAEREKAVKMGRMELGSEYWGTGAYLLMVKFKKENLAAVPFWKHFGIDKQRARATPTGGHPFDTLSRNIHEGLKPRFCCGRIEGLSTCCCGGWTHEKSGHTPKRA